MRPYRVALVGCGESGAAAATAYQTHPRTHVVALCDLVAALVRALGDEIGVDAHYSDLDRMIEEGKPDIVVIPTGTEFHFDLSMCVLEHGVHIDLEKPITIDLEQADALLANAEEKNVRVAVHHQERVGGPLQVVARALRGGRIGRLRHLTASDKGYCGGLRCRLALAGAWVGVVHALAQGAVSVVDCRCCSMVIVQFLLVWGVNPFLN